MDMFNLVNKISEVCFVERGPSKLVCICLFPSGFWPLINTFMRVWITEKKGEILIGYYYCIQDKNLGGGLLENQRLIFSAATAWIIKSWNKRVGGFGFKISLGIIFK